LFSGTSTDFSNWKLSSVYQRKISRS